VTLQSRHADQATGAEITCHGGVLSAVRVWNGSPGTRIEVRHLFYNTPVRRKFMRTPATEMGHICEMLTRVALAQPALHLTLRHNGKAVYEIPASAGLLNRLGLFFGADVQSQLYGVQVQEGPAALSGYIANPACDRGNAKMQYLFVNGRWIRDRSLGHAIQEAYRGLLMTGRYAVAFLFLDLPADQVDVNVHPTKAEVRFRDGHALYHLVFSAVRNRLGAENLTGRLVLTSTLAGPQNYPAGTEYPAPSPFPEASQVSFAGPTVAAPMPSAAGNGAAFAAGTSPPPPNAAALASALAQGPQAMQLDGPGPFKAIQLYDAYLVVETPQGMLVIDQHALHERILFEQLKRNLQTGPLESQRLLIPEPIDLPADQAARALECREALAEFGLGVEDFGGSTILLTSYPTILRNRSPGDILRAVFEHLSSKDRMPTREQLLGDLLSMMACHAAVRSGDRLNADEISALVAQRDLADNTHHCPHGRPTALLFSRHDLDRQFRRV
jgi:DNA mismatch repair protein MutL